ncbi:3'(2'),5'-bisphosphate nucleotidase CysQ [Vibrio sp. 10N.261.52.C2]|uniref:3'(2'),5'-bisphosphate nucleotidase CysQ family protein n=1 Tax=Vibrio sp. 10N.261.52.C2 TaxID=3229681 RepID=UPI00354C51C1
MMLNDLEAVMLALGDKLQHWLTLNGKDGHWEGTQFKAKADLMAHDFLVKELAKISSSIPVVSEEDESTLVGGRPSTYWLIDPIDGTASYIGGFSGYVSQVALMEHGQPILAAIYAPELGLLYSGKQGQGAKLNGEPLEQLTHRSSRILIDNYPEPRGFSHKAYEGLNCDKYIESGSLGLKLLRVADGTADVFVKDVIVRDWDLAPAELILREVGGVLTDIQGEWNKYEGSYEVEGIVCTRNHELHCEVFDWLKDDAK